MSETKVDLTKRVEEIRAHIELDITKTEMAAILGVPRTTLHEFMERNFIIGKERWNLCLSKDDWAYFSREPAKQQSGDDWNNAPYDTNAGEPKGDFCRVAFRGPFERPGTVNG